MGWELRGGRRYYTRSRKVGGRVLREYLGRGPEAELAAALDAARRAEQARRRRAARAEQQRTAVADSLVLSFCSQVELVARAALVAAGHRQHARGQWRRRRHGRDVAGGGDPGAAGAGAGG
jgi:hypothetical protein